MPLVTMSPLSFILAKRLFFFFFIFQFLRVRWIELGRVCAGLLALYAHYNIVELS